MKTPILSNISTNSRYIGNESTLCQIKITTSAISTSSLQLAIPYRHHGIISQILTSTSQRKIPSPNTLIIDNWSALNNSWESLKRNISVEFVVEPKLKIQTVILPITQHDLAVIIQRASIAIIAEKITTLPTTVAGFERRNVDIARNLDTKAPTARNVKRITTIETNIIKRNREMKYQT